MNDLAKELVHEAVKFLESKLPSGVQPWATPFIDAAEKIVDAEIDKFVPALKAVMEKHGVTLPGA